ncbi:hypothetical protein VSAK1_04560 [Vibrio mediterranei AK1]|nr:hypothetical protein VSAK1_04560 [Vibrio mediterranei AK1]
MFKSCPQSVCRAGIINIPALDATFIYAFVDLVVRIAAEDYFAVGCAVLIQSRYSLAPSSPSAGDQGAKSS